MKKISVILVFIFLLCGCTNSGNKAFNIHKYFSSKVYVSTSQINFSGDLSFKKDGTLTLCVNAPEEVKGYTYTVKDNRVKMDFEGLECTCNTNELPTYAPVAVINTVLNEISISPPGIFAEKDGLKAKIEGFSVGFTNSGDIESINSQDLHIAFVKNNYT